MGAQMIECDIAFSKDKVPFIFHDDLLNRTTNGRGYLGHKTWQELSLLDAGSWFSKRFAGEKLISLAELICWHKQYPQIKLNLEIKSMFPTLIPEQVSIILNHLDSQSKVVISSFQVAILQYLKSINNHFERALLVERWSPQSIYLAKSLGCEQLNIGNRFVRSSLIHKTHEAGIKLGVYTVNSKRRFRALKMKGVDAIFTDNCAIDPNRS
jgi:glycerophosphoryl diester phosphodiesterase